LYVSSCAMLVSRECLERTGVPDERLASHHEDLDFCWRARLAGFRVLMTPLGRARDRAASIRGERSLDEPAGSSRYYGERAALASMLKNYGVLSLLMMLPLYAVVGLTRLIGLALARRFDDGLDLLSAWGWNVTHLPGTLRRRARTQSMRTVKDRTIRRFMESSGFRLPKWFEAAGEILAEQREIEREDEGQAPRVRLRHQTASLARSHPVLLASAVALLVGGVGYRDMFGPGTISGAVAAAFPASPAGLFGEFLSGYRTTGLGGAGAGSPALAAIGGLSTLLFGSTPLAQKILLGGLPIVAGLTTYRAVAHQTADRLAGAIAGTAYALSGAVLWAFSDGRIDVLVASAALPALADRLESAFAADAPAQRRRFVVGLGIALAVAVSFFPGVLPAVAVMVLVRLAVAPARLRGAGLTLAGLAAGALLVLPFLPSLVAADGGALGSRIGTLDVHRIGRSALGPGPGTGVVAWFLPVAALFGLSLASNDLRGRALRAALAALVGLGLAWASAAAYLPVALSNPVAYVGLAAASEAMLVGYGLASLAGGVGRESFGWRQFGAAGLAVVLVAGVTFQAAVSMVGGWAWGGPEAIPAAWAVVANRTEGDFRVLWLGDDQGLAFLAPGGDPVGIFEAGANSVRFNLTDRRGSTILDTGRSLSGPGVVYLEDALTRLLSGQTRYAGALLGPLGVRFVVARVGDLPAGTAAALRAQIDLDEILTGGLVIFRNTHALPLAALTADPATMALAAGTNMDAIQRLDATSAASAAVVAGGWSATATAPADLLVASERLSGFRATDTTGAVLDIATSFGWGMRVAAPSGDVQVRYQDQWQRTATVWVLAVLWIAALWITRKPGSSR
ncbi:MAG: hypothetical protein ABI635_07855, partial [Actinomycetota bacterium]